MPKKIAINHDLTATLLLRVDDLPYKSIIDSYRDLEDRGYYYNVIDYKNGFCMYNKKWITLPAWSFHAKEDKEYWIYYLAHEMAHAFTMSGHDSKFMEMFKTICPKHLQHFEIGYKTKQAILAGIVAPDF